MPTKSRPALALLPAAVLLLAGVNRGQQPHYDFLLSDARIVDGTGSPWFAGDIGIVGDHIAAIGDLSKASAARRVKATGLVAAPGFFLFMDNPRSTVRSP